MIIENFLFVVNVTLLVVLTTVVLLVFHKVRRVHLVSYQIAEDAAFARKELKSLFPQIQALVGLEKQLKLDSPLPLLRGWAASPDFLFNIANHIMRNSVETVFECSSGASTVVAARCLQLNGKGHVYSLEHDPGYAEKTREFLRQHKLEDWATVIDAPLEGMKNKTPWYSLENLPTNLPKIDLLIIDGPPEHVGVLARYPALPRLYHFFAQHATIFVDDTCRPDEQEMLHLWQNQFPDFLQTALDCEKGCVRLTRKSIINTGVI